MQVFQAGSTIRHGLHFTPDGRSLLLLSGWPVLFDTLGADPPVTLRPPDGLFAAHAKLARGGSALVYSVGPDLHAWNMSGEVTKWPGAARNVNDLVASPNGMTVYVACDATNGYDRRTTLHAFDATTGDKRGDFPACPSGLNWLSVSADGRRAAGRGAYGFGAWDLTRPNDATAEAVAVQVGGVGKYVDGIALSADGNRAALATSRGVEFWDIAGPKAAEVFRSGKHKRRVSAVACSPTKPLIATGDAGGTVFLWDHAGRVLNRYDWGLSTEVFALCFAPDGQRCAAANGHGKLVVWDVDA